MQVNTIGRNVSITDRNNYSKNKLYKNNLMTSDIKNSETFYAPLSYKPTIQFKALAEVEETPVIVKPDLRILKPTALDFPTVAAYKGFEWKDFQKKSIESAIEGNDTLVVAPTASGKTLIIEETILHNLRSGKQSYYIAPLKALVDDKFEEFKELFGDNQVARLTGDYRTEDALKYPIVAMTNEVYRNMTLKHISKNITPPKATLFIDEVHSMADLQRGSVVEEAIMSSPPGTQICCFSATVKNAEHMRKWIERIHTPKNKKAMLISLPREQRYVPLHYLAYNPNIPGKLFELEQEGISSDIFVNSSLDNSNLSPKQLEALNELEEIYKTNPIIRGRKGLSRIRNNYSPKTTDEFKSTIETISKRANITISPQEMQIITDNLVSNPASLQALLNENINDYRLIPLDDLSNLTSEQNKALEDLGKILGVIDSKQRLSRKSTKKILPIANNILANIEEVNNPRFNFEQTVQAIKTALKNANVQNYEDLAEKISQPFKIRKSNPLIDFINAITVNKEIIFSDANSEEIIKNRLLASLKKQGFSPEEAEQRANNYVEKIRKAFCSFYDNPQINTISKAVNYSKNQYITRHLIEVPHSKKIEPKIINELKQSFSPNQIKLLSLFGYMSNYKAVKKITDISEIEKQMDNNDNFIKGLKYISSFSNQKIKTKESFIEQIIIPRLSRLRYIIKQKMNENLNVENPTVTNYKRYEDFKAFLENELSDKKINAQARTIMDSMLKKNPDRVLSIRDILNQLIKEEQEKQLFDTSPDNFMFKINKNKKKFTPEQYIQLKSLGETLTYKNADKNGFIVYDSLQRTTKFPQLNQLQAFLRKAMKKSHIPDTDAKINNIIKNLTQPLTAEEIEQLKIEKINQKVKGKINLQVHEIQTTTPEQASALKILSSLYEHLNSEHEFISKHKNNSILRLMKMQPADMDLETFEKMLSEILLSIQEPDALKRAHDITEKLKTKIVNKSLESDFTSTTIVKGNKHNYMPDLVETMRKADLFPGLFFVFSRKGCGERLNECTSDPSVDLLTMPEKQQVKNAINEAVKSGEILDTQFEHTKSSLLKGFSTHHAGKMPAYKTLIQKLAKNGLSRVTFATETLSAGIDYPIRTTVITSLTKPEGDETGNIITRDLKASELQQYTGRAGRLGRDKQGFSIIVSDNIADFKHAINLAERVPEAVESHYRPSYGLVANLLMRNSNINDLDTHFARSFLVEECSDADSRDDVLRQLRSRTDDIMHIMIENGFIEKTDNYGNYRVTAKGQIASMAKGVNEILFTELITNPKLLNLENLDSSMFAGIISSLTYDSSQIHHKLKSNAARSIIDTFNSTDQIMKDVLDSGISNKIAEIIRKEKDVEASNILISDATNPSLKRSFINFNKWMAPFVYKWARFPEANDISEFWNELTGVMKDGFLLKDSADFTRTISNTSDLLIQIENIIDYIDENDFYKELNLDPISMTHMKGLAQKAIKEICKIRLH